MLRRRELEAEAEAPKALPEGGSGKSVKERIDDAW